MSSVIDTAFESISPYMMDYWGEPVLVTPHGSSQRTINAIVLRETRRPVDIESHSNMFNVMDILILATNNTDGIVSPSEFSKAGGADVYVIDSKTWTCQRILERNIGGQHRLELHEGGT